ncbi:MAG: chemotaxis protein CheW [bacterium]
MLSNFHKDKKKKQEEQRQYIVFSIGSKLFGVDIKQTREIIQKSELTSVPSAPSCVKGVIDLRGKIVPIVDLKKRLNIEISESIEDEKIIITKVNNLLIGMEVENVKEIIKLKIKDIAAPPEIVKDINRDYLSGIGKIKGNLLVLLDLDKVLSQEEIRQLDGVI